MARSNVTGNSENILQKIRTMAWCPARLGICWYAAVCHKAYNRPVATFFKQNKNLSWTVQGNSHRSAVPASPPFSVVGGWKRENQIWNTCFLARMCTVQPPALPSSLLDERRKAALRSKPLTLIFLFLLSFRAVEVQNGKGFASISSLTSGGKANFKHWS